MIPLRVVAKNILRHPVRSILTAGSLTIAIFLLATLHAFLQALDSQVEQAEDNRVIVQSAVSLFVSLPTSYQTKIAQVEGVETACKWTWFGGYYQDERNFFAQFAVDENTLLETYPEMQIIAGSYDDFRSRRTACLIGEGLAEKFDWKVGDTVPITSNIFVPPGQAAWEFDVAAIYSPTKSSFDKGVLFFHFDYLDETLETGGATGPRGTSTYSLRLAPGVEPTQVMGTVDAMFENGPIKTQTVPESAFNAQFVSMWGNVPQFVSSIGLGVFIAVLVACVNTMLMAARQQTHDIGVMKALGFTDRSMSGVFLLQSLGLCLLGGGLGLGLASLLPMMFAGTNFEAFFPGIGMGRETLQLGILATLLVGLIAGIVPAYRALKMTPVAALRSEG